MKLVNEPYPNIIFARAGRLGLTADLSFGGRAFGSTEPREDAVRQIECHAQTTDGLRENSAAIVRNSLGFRRYLRFSTQKAQVASEVGVEILKKDNIPSANILFDELKDEFEFIVEPQEPSNGYVTEFVFRSVRNNTRQVTAVVGQGQGLGLGCIDYASTEGSQRTVDYEESNSMLVLNSPLARYLGV